MSKDWKGNSQSTYKMIGASNHCAEERASHDYYASDPETVIALCREYDFPHTIYECACGAGHLSKALEQMGHRVISTDLVYRGYGKGGVDFLNLKQMPHNCRCIITNPPYKYANEFILHALDLLPNDGIIAMLLNINYLSGKQRYSQIFTQTPPRYVFVFSGRVVCAKNGNFSPISKMGGAINYAWFVWEKGYKGNPEIKWL